jgi:hypothetical protein
MNKTPYLITEVGDINDELSQDMQAKQAYLAQVENAVLTGDDREIYELFDRQRYGMEVRHEENAVSNRTFALLIDDMRPKLNHHLSKNLVAYLADKFPFLFFEETELGSFKVFYGDWWDRREFGRLDPITVSLILDPEEYQKLDASVKLQAEDKTLHADEIAELRAANESMQKVLDGQAERDAERATFDQVMQETEKKGLFGGGKNADARQEAQDGLARLNAADEKAQEIPTLIAENQQMILDFEKEETILDYEQRAAEEVFGDFDTFIQNVGRLYADYVTFLANREG